MRYNNLNILLKHSLCSDLVEIYAIKRVARDLSHEIIEKEVIDYDEEDFLYDFVNYWPIMQF